MSTPFDQFIGQMTARMGVNTGTQPLKNQPFSPLSEASPSPNAPSLASENLLALIQGTINQAQPPPPPANPAIQQQVQQGFTPPTPQMASVGMPSGGGTQGFAPSQEDAPDGPWVMVEYQSADGPTWFYIPEAKLFEAPEGVRVREDTRTTDPLRIEAARQGGYTYDTQPPETQSAFRTAQEASNARVEQQRQMESGQYPKELPVGPPSAPSNVAVRSDDDLAAIYGPEQEEEPVYQTTELRAQANAAIEAGQEVDQGTLDFITLLEQNGITVFRESDVLMQNPSTGKLQVYAPEETVTDPTTGQSSLVSEHETNEPVGTPLPALTTAKLRETNPSAANDLEASGIFLIRQGQVAVRLPNGMMMVVNEGSVPEGAEVLAYGGKSEPLADKRLIDGPGDIVKPIPIVAGGIKDAALSAVGPVMEGYDKVRQANVSNRGEDAYEWAKGDRGGSYNGRDILPSVDLPISEVADAYFSPNFVPWVNENPDIVIDVYENGYTDPKTGEHFEGGRAVWERYSADQPKLARIASDYNSDLLNAIPFAGSIARGAARGVLGEGDDVTRGALAVSRGLNAVGTLADLPDNLIGKPIGSIWKGAGNLVKALPRDIPVGLGRWNPVTKQMEYPKVLPGPGRLAEIADPVTQQVGRANQALRDLMRMESQQGPQGQQPLGPSPDPANPAPAPAKPGGAGPTHGQIVEEPALPMEVRPDTEDFSRPDGWRYLSPESNVATGQRQPRIVDKAWDARRDHPEEWRAFFDQYDDLARSNAEMDAAYKAEAMAAVEAGDTTTRARMNRGQALNDARHVIDDLMPIYNQTMGGKIGRLGPEDYRFQYDLDGGAAKLHDSQIIEHYIFEPEDSKNFRKAENAVRINADRNTNGFAEIVPELTGLRQRYWSQVEGAPIANPHAAVVGSSSRRYEELPLSSLRKTTEMTDAELEAVGLFPTQFRNRRFSEQTASSVHKNRRVNLPPIQVVRGTDGNPYILDGHSRHEGLRRRGESSVDVQWIDGTPDELREAAEFTNQSGTGYGPDELPERIKSAMDGGMSKADAAREFRQGNEAYISSGKTGEVSIAQYLNVSHLPPTSTTREAFNQGQLSLAQASELGAAVNKNLMSVPQVDQFFVDIVAPNELSAKAIRTEITNHAQRMRSMGVQTGMDTDALFNHRYRKAQQDLFENKTAIGKLTAEQNSLVRKTGKDSLSGEQAVRIPTESRARYKALGKQIDELKAQREVLEQEARDSFYGNDLDAPAPAGNELSSQALFANADAQARADAERLYDSTIGRLNERVPNPYAASLRPSRIVADDAGSVYTIRGRQPAKMLREVLDTVLDGGETLGQRWARRADELETFGLRDDTGKVTKVFETPLDAEQEAAAQVLNDLATTILKDQKPKQYQRYLNELERLSKKPTGDNRITAVREAKALAAATGGGPASLKAYDGALSILREMALYNAYTGWRYILTQALGNSLTALLTGHAGIITDALRPGNYKGALREVREGSNKAVWELHTALHEIGEQPAAIIHDAADGILAELGLGGVRDDLGRLHKDQIQGIPGMEGSRASSSTRLRNAADNLRLGRLRLPKMGWATSPLASKNIRDWANAYDLSFRKTLYAHQMQNGVAAMRGDLYRHMLDSRPQRVSEDAFNEAWNRLPTVFGSDRIRNTFSALDAGWAERMARDWQNSVLHLDAASRQEVRRVFFSGEETNADQILRRTVFFHYWMSRAVPLYTASVAKHPGLMNAYFNAMDALERDTKDESPSVRGMLKVMNSWLGWNIYIRPDAMFQLFSFVGERSSYSPDGESSLARFMRESGLFWNPIVASVANYAGLMGETFAPDPLQLGQWSNLVQQGINALKAVGWVANQEPTGNFYADINAKAREAFSGWTDGWLPGASEVPFTDQNAFNRRELNFLIQDVAEEQGLDPNGPEAQAALDDPESALYEEAFRRFVLGQGAISFLRMTPLSPLYPKGRVAEIDDVSRGIATTTGEAQQALYDQRDMANTSDPKARQLKLDANAYYGLGTQDERAAWTVYNQIRYGDLEHPVTIQGVVRNERALSGLSDGERKAMADRWADETGVAGKIDSITTKRDSFRESHPEWDAYLTWSQQVRTYDGGAYVYWRDMTDGDRNPNAARWLSDQDEFVDLDDMQRTLTGIEAYMAYSGTQPSLFDPVPTDTSKPGAVPYNPAATQGQGQGQPGREKKSPEDRIADALSDYETDMAEYNAQVSAYLGQPVDMDNINPMAANAYASHLAQAGIMRPSLSAEAQAYLAWAAAQPPGTDTSIAAFVRWAGQQ